MIPKLSIIIPTYKRTQSLERLLDALSLQDCTELEVVIVDQNPSGFFNESLLTKLKKLIYVHQESPNASLARNNGFKNSTAPYILFLDDDLIPERGFCSKGISIFKEFTLIKCFVPLVYPQNGKEEWLSYTKKKALQGYPGNKLIYSITDFISAAVFFERSYFELSGGFDTYLFSFAKASEDVELFLRMKQKNMVLWFVSFLEIFHDETSDGGCEMRSAGYWVTRKKNARAMSFRYRIHNETVGNLSIANIIQLSRSFVFNKEVIKSGVNNIIKEARLLLDSIKESKVFYNDHKKFYTDRLYNFIK